MLPGRHYDKVCPACSNPFRGLVRRIYCSVGCAQKANPGRKPQHGHSKSPEDVRDAEGRATGEVRKIPTDAQPTPDFVRIANEIWADPTFERIYAEIKKLASQPSPAATVETILEECEDLQGRTVQTVRLADGTEEVRTLPRSSAGSAGEIDTRKLIASILSEFFPGKQWYRDLAALAIFERVVSAQPQAVKERVWTGPGHLEQTGYIDKQPGHTKTCERCEGDGYIRRDTNLPDVKCPDCNGWGYTLSRPQSRTGEA